MVNPELRLMRYKHVLKRGVLRCLSEPLLNDEYVD